MDDKREKKIVSKISTHYIYFVLKSALKEVDVLIELVELT